MAIVTQLIEHQATHVLVRRGLPGQIKMHECQINNTCTVLELEDTLFLLGENKAGNQTCSYWKCGKMFCSPRPLKEDW